MKSFSSPSSPFNAEEIEAANAVHSAVEALNAAIDRALEMQLDVRVEAPDAYAKPLVPTVFVRITRTYTL